MERKRSRSPFSITMKSQLEDRKRTLFALLAASAISLVIWGVIVALNVQ